jgi:hypothetical protein
MIAALFEFLIEIVLEMAIEFGAEILAEFGLGALERFREGRSLPPVIAVISYGSLGIVLGVISAYFVPGHLNFNDGLRLASRIVSPVLLGLSLCLISWIISRRDRGEPFFRLDKFISGAIMSIGFSFTRFAILGH